MRAGALVLGGAEGVWEEVIALERMLGRPWDGAVVAANDVGVYWPRDLHHWATLHPHKLAEWKRQRTAYGFPGGYVTWGRRAGPLVDRDIVPWDGGSSGMMAVQLAIENLALTQVVLCGVPMTPTRHFAESVEEHVIDPQGNWSHADRHWKAWERVLDRMRGQVRSMSGRTREVFGAPDVSWLCAETTEEEVVGCQGVV